MKALILAAGFGKRLGEITKSTPKCLIKYNKNNTIIDMWIKKLLECGIKNILINTHYKSDQVENYIKKNYFKNHQIKTIFEKKILGTGMTFFKNKIVFKGNDVIVLHADNYAPNFNLKNLIIYHKKKPKKAMVTILAFRTDDFKNSGIVHLDDNKMLKKHYEKKNKKYGSYANGAVYIFSKQAIKNFSKPRFNNLFLDICSQFKKSIYVYKYKGTFIDIGLLKNYKKIKKLNNLK